MIKRHCINLIKSSLTHFPAVLLIGARQVGKSTLAQQLISEGVIDHYITLDDLTHLDSAKSDPDNFLLNLKGRVAIDEIQRVPDLMRALKKSIDFNRTSGRFLLTGSANILHYPQVSESLAGRMDILLLEGFSFSESLNKSCGSDFLNKVFGVKDFSELLDYATAHKPTHPFLKEKLASYIYFGGFPEIYLKQDQSFLQRWFSAYQTAYIERDVRNVASNIEIIPFSKLIRLSALQTANLFNMSSMSQSLGLDLRTVEKYLGILSLTFQVQQLAPWHANTVKRLVKSSKLFLYDSGLACYLAGIDSPEKLLVHPFWGGLFETWFYAELRKMALYCPGIMMHFYRTYQGQEVAFILEKGNRAIAIALKSAQQVTQKDLKGLKTFQESYPGVCFGIVVYTGQEVVSFSETLAAVPLECVLV